MGVLIQNRFAWSRKILLVFCFMLILLLILSGITFYNSIQIRNATIYVKKFDLPLSILLDEMKQSAGIINVSVLNYILTEDEAEKEQIINVILTNCKDNGRRFRELKNYVRSDVQLLEAISESRIAYCSFSVNLIKRHDSLPSEIDFKSVYQLQALFNNYRNSMNALGNINMSRTSGDISQISNYVSRTTVIINALLLLILFMSFYLGWIITRIMKKEKSRIAYLQEQIEERKRAEAAISHYADELKAVNAGKDKLISVISHDLRSPATSIVSSAELLKSHIDELTKEEIGRLSGIILKSSGRLLDQLNDLLLWVKAQTVKELFRPVNLHLQDTFIKVRKLLEENILQKEIELINKIDDDHCVKADQVMLYSVIQNLLSNSIKFTPRGGKITVGSEEENEWIVLKITDTGVGMTEEQKAELFTGKASTSGTEKEAGSGLGLSLTKDFIEKHGGTVSVDSSPGKGTTFSVRLPSAENC
jgi:signal transduction histidine kinase